MARIPKAAIVATKAIHSAGLVEELGPGVTQFKKGDAVYGPVQGAYAEYALATASELQPKPARLNFEEAASVPVGALTA